MLKFSFKELSDLVEDASTCVVKKTLKQIMSLHPSCLINIERSIKENLSNYIGKFDKRLEGVILGYANVRVCSVGMIRNDCPNVRYDVKADFFVFQPYIKATLRGIVDRKCDTHLSLIVHKVFNVVIPRPVNQSTLAWSDTSWIGDRLKLGQETEFSVEFLDLHCALPYIRGNIEDSCDDTSYFMDETDSTAKKRKHERSKSKSHKPHRNGDLSDTTAEHKTTIHAKVKRKSKKSQNNISTDSVGESSQNDSVSESNNSTKSEKSPKKRKKKAKATSLDGTNYE